MRYTTRTLISALALGCLPASAQLIGVEPFDADGAIGGQTGGTGWDYDILNSTTTGSPSNWDNTGGTPNVVGGTLVTDESSAKREHNGADEGNGALRGNGVVFYKVEMNRSSGAVWSGLSVYDFGAERSFFGVPGSGAATDTIGIVGGGFPDSLGSISLTDGQTYTMIAVHDFDNNQQALFIDPDGSDYYEVSSGGNSADVTRTYTATNWTTATRLGSGGEVTWDNLESALDPVTIGLQSSIDNDQDTLSDTWETANGLDPTDDGTIGESSSGAKDGPNGALGDPDGDNVTNADEEANGTHPNLADTDDDGLNDDIELAGPTDALNPDSDEDGLSDGDEVNTHGTDPLVVDSDTGGTADFTEVALLGDPTEPADDSSLPTGDLDLIGLDFFGAYSDGPLDGAAGGTGFDYDNAIDVETFNGHTTMASDWTNVGGAPSILAGRLITQETSIKREFHGGSNNQADVFGESSGAFREDSAGTGLNGRDLLYAKVEITRSAGAQWGGLSLYNYGTERVFVGVNGTGPYTFAMQDSTDSVATRTEVLDEFGDPISPVDDETNVIVAKYDFVTGEVTMFLNPDLEAAEPDFGSDNTATITLPAANILGTSIRLGSGGSGATAWDALVVGTTWDSLKSQPSDSDGDGMPDDWEIANGLDPHDDGSIDPIKEGANGDFDADGMINFDEYTVGTVANNDDTDDDDLTDGTGETAHGTDPLKDDTDGDGLKDGDEVNGNNPSSYVSDPTLADTDGDGQKDPGEIEGDSSGRTSDPNDPNDTVGGPIGLIGCDGFFSNGPIQGQTGTEGFDYENWLLNGPFVGHTGTTSDWDGEAMVANGVLVTQENGATRDFNGPVEGAGTNLEPTDARMGAVNNGGDHDQTVVYFKAEMTRQEGATSSMIVSDDFGAERVAFGVIEDGEYIEWGVEKTGFEFTTDFGTLPVVVGQTYTVIGKLDYGGDLLSLWVDPDLNDTEENNQAIVTLTYTEGNWCSGMGFRSAGTGDTEWDNLVVANTWDQLNKEIAAPLLVDLEMLGFITPTSLELGITGIQPGQTIHVSSSADLQTWTPIPGSEMSADGTLIVDPVPVPGSEFYQVFEGPIPTP